MLYAVPKSIVSWGFEVYHEQTLIAVIDMAWLTEGGSFHYENSIYYARKAGFMSGSFSMECNGEVIAQAQKTPLLRCFDVRYGYENYTLAAASPFTRRFVLSHNERIVGEIAPHHPLTRKSFIHLPEEISISGRLFMFWLVLLMWRRAAQSAAASG